MTHVSAYLPVHRTGLVRFFGRILYVGLVFVLLFFFSSNFRIFFSLSYLFKCLCVAYKSHLIYNAQHDQTNGTPNIENNNLS